MSGVGSRSRVGPRTRTVSRPAIVGAIIAKDAREYLRDRLWLFLTALSLVFLIVIFWVLPDRVDESITVGISGIDAAVVQEAGGDGGEAGMEVMPVPDAADLRAVVAGERKAWRADAGSLVVAASADERVPRGATAVRLPIGLAFPDGFFDALQAGQPATVEVLVDSGVPPELRAAMSAVVRELAYGVAGSPPPVSFPDPRELYTVVGEDRVGSQVTARELFRPLVVVMVLIFELLGMSSLISRELQAGTATAVLVTPATVGDLLVAKGLTGMALGLTQSVVLLAAIGLWSTQPLLLLALMVAGAAMVSGAAMIAGCIGRDMMANLIGGVIFMVPMMIPAVAVLFPGSASPWVRVLPTHALVQALVNVTAHGAGWADAAGHLGLSLAWAAAFFAAGWLVLRRRVLGA